jgi:hypothetical protein
VSEHIHAHQSKDDEHNHRGHDPHDTHFRFLSISFTLIGRRIPLFLPSTLLSLLLGAGCNIAPH